MIMTLLLYCICDISAVFLFYQAVANKKNRKLALLFLILSFSILFILAGFRHISVGVDTKGYVDVFGRIVNGTMTTADKNWLSIGYVVLNKIIGTIFGTHYLVLNMFVSFITLLFLYKSIWDNSDSPTISLFLFICMCLYYQMFNQSRQLLAISIILYSFKYIKEKKFLKYALTVLLAASMHKSAIIMLPIYFVCQIKINEKTLLFYLIVGLFFALCSDFIIKLIMQTSYGKIYASSMFFQPQLSSLFNLAVRLGMLGCALFFGKNLIKKDENSHYLYHLIFICTLLQILTLRISILGRMTTYFYVAYILLIPKILKNIDYRKLATVAVVVLFMLYHIVYFLYASGSSGYDIYRFFF